MWPQNWRNQIWTHITQPWDIIIIGGGITGAGILREAARLGLKALLVEQRDFAWGTSSRSSKLVHGGLRYLKEGKFGLTLESVQERQQLLSEGPGLVNPLGFLLAAYEGDKVSRLAYRAGLTVYDLLALQWSHRYYDQQDFRMLAPHLTKTGLKGGFRYGDAQTDDARLVLRVIQEAVTDGATAVNYVTAVSLTKDDTNMVTGVVVQDELTGATAAAPARVVVNATGAWADQLRAEVGGEVKIRPLRGSHLVFPAWRLPVAQAVSFLHPIDQRPVFIFPWEGVTLVGTTDVDHQQALNEEPGISPQEVAYLMAAIESQFPTLNLTLADITATFAGVRPVIGSGKLDPSQESRDHVVWQENGLLTVTGGKLTTFRIIAQDALKAVRHRLPDVPEPDTTLPVLNPVPELVAESLTEEERRRLNGRYGLQASALIDAAHPHELAAIPTTPTLWAELRWAARSEAVVHLDDLLLRRTRLGLMLPGGGQDIMPTVQAICQAELGWSEATWQAELARYEAIWQQSYGVPNPAAIPDWRQMVMAARLPVERTGMGKRPFIPLAISAITLLLTAWWLRRRTQPAA